MFVLFANPDINVPFCSDNGKSAISPICKKLEIMIHAIIYYLERASLPISSTEHLIKCLIKTYKVLTTLTKLVSKSQLPKITELDQSLVSH